MLNSSIWLIDRTLSGATTPGQSGPGSNTNEVVLHTPQNSLTVASPSYCQMSSSGHSLVGGGRSYSSEEMQSVYFAATDDWTTSRSVGQLIVEFYGMSTFVGLFHAELGFLVLYFENIFILYWIVLLSLKMSTILLLFSWRLSVRFLAVKYLFLMGLVGWLVGFMAY